MKILVVDDEAPARQRLRRLIEDIPGCEVAGEAADGVEAVRMADRTAADIVLLDVRMPGMDGLEVARHLCGAEPPPAIVFTTAFGDHALEAFEARAVDYLVKPVRAGRLSSAIEAAGRQNRAQLQTLGDGEAPRQQLCARLGGQLQMVEVDDVRYFMAEHKYVTVRHGCGEVLLEEPLKALEEEFGTRFLRVHRRALVAPRWVGGMRKSSDGRPCIWFHDIDDTIEVSRRHLATVRQRLRAGQG